MGNMKSQPYMKIAVSEGVGYSDLLAWGINHMDEDCMWPVDIDFNGKMAIVTGASDDLPPGSIGDLVACIQDHMDNIDPEDWLGTRPLDYHTGDNHYVSTRKGTYYGQDIVVEVTIVEYSTDVHPIL